jgi:hypothetical protein
MPRLSFALLVIASVAMFFDTIVRISARNFLFSDLFLLLSVFVLVLDRCGRSAFLTEAFRSPITVPIGIFLASALFGVTVHATDPGINPVSTFLAIAQLIFVFLVMGPLIFVHARNETHLRRLWTVQILMIALAGSLSLTDAMGLTHFTDQPDFWREINPLLGVNGFWLFGMVSGLILMRTIRARGGRRLWYAALWTVGFAGVVLGGVRGGLVLTAGSIFWVGRRFLRDVLRPRFSVAAVKRLGLATVVLLFATLMAGILIIQLPVFQTRVDLEEVSTISRRLDAITIAIPEIPHYISAGSGLNQFLNLHPEAGDLVHNIILQALFETGLVGALAFTAMFFAAYRNTTRWRRRTADPRDPAREDQWDASTYATIGAFVAGIVYPIGFTRFDWFIFLIAVGPFLAQRRSLGSRPAPVTSQRAAALPG